MAQRSPALMPCCASHDAHADAMSFSWRYVKRSMRSARWISTAVFSPKRETVSAKTAQKFDCKELLLRRKPPDFEVGDRRIDGREPVRGSGGDDDHVAFDDFLRHAIHDRCGLAV